MKCIKCIVVKFCDSGNSIGSRQIQDSFVSRKKSQYFYYLSYRKGCVTNVERIKIQHN